MMNKISFGDYDKITDTMLYLGSKVSLCFTVKLCKQNNNVRYPMHKEYLLNNNYTNSRSLITVKRNFDYYMELIYKDKRTYFSFKIIPENIIYIIDQLNKVSSWFRNDNLFAVVNNSLTMIGSVEPIKIIFSDTNVLTLEPIVYNNPYNGTQEARLRMSFDDYTFADVSIEKLMGLVYLTSSINLYQSAQILINYLQAPSYGHNLVDMTTNGQEDDIYDDYEDGVEVSKGGSRRVQAGRSIFDKIDDM